MRASAIAITAAAVLLAAPPSYAAWTLQQSTGSQDTTYISVGAGSTAVAAAVGLDNSQGNTQVIYAHTLDGDAWIDGGFTQWASALEFADASIGYAGGLIGKVWQTLDGGSTWTELPAAAVGGTVADGEAIADVAIAEGGAIVWIVGSNGRCSHSEDFGATWARIDVPLPAGDGLQITAAEIRGGTIWLVGGLPMVEPTEATDTDSGSAGAPASSGFVLRSEDGGAAFDEVASGLEYALNDVSFVNPAEGWAAAAKYTDGGGAIGVTTDGGETWDFSGLPALPEEEIAFAGMGATTAVGACVRAQFFGRQVGVASCTTQTFENDGINALFLTTDGGASWALQAGYKAMFANQMASVNPIMDIAFPDCHRGWLAGSGKIIMRWDNDDAALDCAAGGAPGDDVPDDVGGSGSSRDGCGCTAIGADGGAGSLLGALLR
jgi:photosystem II stability/assembly factor-like uncharacterized protein